MIHVSCWRDLEEYILQGLCWLCSCGVEDYIQKHLGNVVAPAEGKNVNLTLHISKTHVTNGGSIALPRSYLCVDDYLKNVASIHRFVLAAPFNKYLSALQESKQSALKPKIVSFYSKEPMFVHFAVFYG